MKSALITATLGIILTSYVGILYCGLGWPEVVGAIVVSNFAALISLLAILKGERTPWIKKKILNRSLKTWLAIALLYTGFLLLGIPALRDVHRLELLFLPLLLSTGFGILAFGPIQDRIVHALQRAERERKSRAS